MKKIPSIFIRDWKGDKSKVTDECNPDALWVFKGEGVATRKYDGTAVMVDESGNFWVRYDAKNGKTPPSTFRPCQEPDPETGHQPGWITADKKMHKWHLEAFRNSTPLSAGTFEACGPHFQGNPEHFDNDILVRHGMPTPHLAEAPRTFMELTEWFKGKDIEGIVWHHPDGRMAKIKKSDFGLRRTD